MGKTDASYQACWSVNSYTVSFNSNGGETAEPITEEFGKTISLPTVSKAGYDFGGWFLSDGTEWTADSTVPANDVALNAKWISRGDTAYTVVHHYETLSSGEYIADAPESLNGTTERKTAAVAKEKDGFSALPFEQKVILGDGSTVVDIYYQRCSYTVTWNANGGEFNGAEACESTLKFGESIALPETPTRDGFDFISWMEYNDDMTMPAHGILFKAEWAEHSFSNYVSNNDASCDKDGTKTSKCDRCSITDTIIDEGSRLGHNWDSGVLTSAPSCAKNGEMTYTCERCSSTKTESVEKTAHIAGEPVIENLVEAGCTACGSYSEVVKCTACGEELSREERTIKPNGHTAGKEVIENEVLPTCEESGSLEKVIYCADCGCELSRTAVSLSALGHSFETSKGEDGTVFSCSVCGFSYTEKCPFCVRVRMSEGSSIQALYIMIDIFYHFIMNIKDFYLTVIK